ncbi:hypothetical protein [Cupriavidus sp. BIC8F]|uniref:hypothetical protein n=1 Tax=Cupriavidus sp. BIC8F TaxID=3079014 RepID=UPI0029163C57|nr:hypothetical protein [Cupriavidus sp. BIC8F]
MSTTLLCRMKAVALLLALAAGAAHAQQGQSMEERLRNQLRITTTQLQQAQNELAALKAGQSPRGGAGGGDAGTLRKELDAARAQLAAERDARDKLAGSARQAQQHSQAVAEKAGSQIAQYRGAYDELLRMARGLEAERQRLAAEATARQTVLSRCEAANAQLYAAGQDILRAYETVDLGTVLAARQPFAAQSRVRYEQIAQEYGDKLYQGRFDARSTGEAAAPQADAAPAKAAAEPKGEAGTAVPRL